MRGNLVAIVVSVAVVIALLACTFLLVNRPVTIEVRANLPRDFPSSGFSHASFEMLLHRYVDVHGEVNFADWHANQADRDALEGYLSSVAAYSPENAADRFPSRSHALAYWMYAYNAYVVKSVLDHWPLDSVTDVKAPIEAVTGLGFFYRQRFLFGGEPLSLYAVENERIRRAFEDPRIHFVLYCASGSCPPIRPELPTGDALDALLARATQEFVADTANVQVDHERREIRLSPIFELYKSDFTRELTRRGLPSQRGVVDYVALVAPAALGAELRAAAGYRVVFDDYDWSLASQ